VNDATNEADVHDAIRWLIALLAAFAILWLLLFARGEPGVGGRQPDPPNAAAGLVVQPEMT
jgi:hypothetical protein